MKDNCFICCDGNSRTEKWQWGQNEGRHYIFEHESVFTGFGLALRHCHHIESLRSTVRTSKVVFVLGILSGGWFAWTSAVFTVTHTQFTPTPTFPIFLLPSAVMDSCSALPANTAGSFSNIWRRPTSWSPSYVIPGKHPRLWLKRCTWDRVRLPTPWERCPWASSWPLLARQPHSPPATPQNGIDRGLARNDSIEVWRGMTCSQAKTTFGVVLKKQCKNNNVIGYDLVLEIPGSNCWVGWGQTVVVFLKKYCAIGSAWPEGPLLGSYCSNIE